MNPELKLIRQAWDALNSIWQATWNDYGARLLTQCEREEREHRSFGSDFRKYHPDAPSVRDMAKLFAVKRVAEFLQGEPFPVGKDYLHTQTSCFIAAGLADEFGSKIRESWATFDLATLAALNYTNHVKAVAA